MKHLALGLMIVALSGGMQIAVSQSSFTFTAIHTSGTDTLGSEIVLDGAVTNTSTSPLTLAFIRVVNTLPSGWESSMCLDLCYPPNIDTIATTAAFGTSPLAPNETRPFSVHIFPLVNHGTGVVRVKIVDMRNAADSLGVTFSGTSRTTSVTTREGLPLDFHLEQNYPNPFNPKSTIEFSLREAAFTTLKVYSLLGEEIAVLVNEQLQSGNYRSTFDAQGLASGAYYYTLQSGMSISTKKLIILK